MVGLGFQEMIFPYLGSGEDYIEKMEIEGGGLVRIANPMTEGFEYVRNSIIPSLLQAESVSANAVYPHHIFEVGKTACLDSSKNYGTRTDDALGFLSAGSDAGFNLVNSHVSALLYYLSLDYALEELEDPRFIPGRTARIFCGESGIGVFGEIHPQVLTNWGIEIPCSACEITIAPLLLEKDE
jgi:phenylalanyl-tRNA synthetase beta chain